jgi:hypothetical protein
VTTKLQLITIIIIIIIIIIITNISFMQGIYTYIPETNTVPKQHNVTAILSLLFMVLLLLLLLLLSVNGRSSPSATPRPYLKIAYTNHKLTHSLHTTQSFLRS